MKQWKTLKTWLCGGCVYFTVIALVMIFLNFATGGSESINTVAFLLFLPCGLCISAAGMLLQTKALPRWSRYLLHYIITVLSLFLFLGLPMNPGIRASTGLILIVMITVLYWIFFGLIIWIRSRVRQLMEED